MARAKKKPASPHPHRGKVSAQGGGTEKSHGWDQEGAPTLSEVLELVDRLEKSLTARERKMRAEALSQARECLERLAQAPAWRAPPPIQKSFPQPPLAGGIRIDVDIFAGNIVP